MTGTPFPHAVKLFLVMVNDCLITCVIQYVEVCISDECGQRHDRVTVGVQAGHLAGSTIINYFENNVKKHTSQSIQTRGAFETDAIVMCVSAGEGCWWGSNRMNESG